MVEFAFGPDNIMCMSDSVMLCFVQGFDGGRDKDAKDNSKEHKLQLVKNKLLRKSRSSANFGSAGVRSAPSTPQGLLGSSPVPFSDPLSQPSSPGYITPSIQRSPSHNIFTKYDKGALKQLSCSTPAMTAQAQSPEPPSPKASSKDEKNTTSKARQKKFHRHFPVVDDDEKVLNHYSCALIGDILLQGQLYITNNYFAFYSNVFGYVTKLLIPLLSVQKITKEKTARIIPNAIGITTLEDKHVFGSLMSRDNAYRYMYDVWDRARSSAPIEPIPSRRTPSDISDSSETREESGRESAASEANPDFRKCAVKKDMRKVSVDCVDKPILEITSSKLAEDPRIPYFSKQKLLLFASTLLLVLLFLSAAVLLYRIGKIQHKYTLALQDNFAVTESDDVYNELLQWQTHLHSKSAGAVHSFLDTNLDQIAKVRQSLEALSTLLMPNESNTSHNTPATATPTSSPPTSDVPKES
ncbi:hypothetical protein Trydic_g18211 [Trypoxylus dichotomus]